MLKQVIPVVISKLQKIMRRCEMQLLYGVGQCVCEKDGVWCGEIERIRVNPVVAYLNLLH